MRSGIVETADYIKNKGGYSELKVMKSAAGWYIGTTYTDPDDGFTEPGSRDSDYYTSQGEAEKALKLYESFEEDIAHSCLRQNP